MFPIIFTLKKVFTIIIVTKEEEMTLEKVVLLADHLGTCTTVMLPKTVHYFFFSHQDKTATHTD